MNNLNSVLMEGTLLKDPVVRTTSDDVSVCHFTLEIKRYGREGSQESTRIDVEVFGIAADACIEKLTKGRGARVVGRLQQKADHKISVLAEHIEFNPRLTERV